VFRGNPLYIRGLAPDTGGAEKCVCPEKVDCLNPLPLKDSHDLAMLLEMANVLYLDCVDREMWYGKKVMLL